VTSRPGGSNGNGVPPPRRANSWTALSPTIAGMASAWSASAIIQAG
jgi:hypothetical protein